MYQLPMDQVFFDSENKEPFQKIGTLLVKMLHQQMELAEEGGRYYDSADVKIKLKISDKTLYRMRKSGLIPFFKLGKKIFYPKRFFRN